MDCLTEGGAAGLVLGRGFAGAIIWYLVCYVACAHSLKFRFSWLQILLSFALTWLVVGVSDPIVRSIVSSDSRGYMDLFSIMVVPLVSAVAIIWLFLRAVRQGARNVRVVEDAPEKK
jgi:hypothetical protein